MPSGQHTGQTVTSTSQDRYEDQQPGASPFFLHVPAFQRLSLLGSSARLCFLLRHPILSVAVVMAFNASIQETEAD